MKAEVEIWQKVYERTTAVVDIPDDERGGTKEETILNIEEYVLNNFELWYDTAYITHDEVLGPDGDQEITVTILEEA